MNILQISFHTAPMNNLGENDGGGLSVYVEAISKELAKDNSIHVITGEEAKNINKKNLKLVSFNLFSNQENIEEKRKYLDEFIDKTFQYVEENDIDVVHAHYWLSGLVAKKLKERYKIPFVLQHSQGTPENMQNKPKYKNELLEIYDFFEQKIKFLKKNGIKHNKIIIDPGIGFGKNLKHNINLISNISIFHSLGFPILVGNSKKRFIKEIAEKNDTKNRIGGTIASSIYLMMQGIQILRIHDVNELVQGIKVFKKIINH